LFGLQNGRPWFVQSVAAKQATHAFVAGLQIGCRLEHVTVPHCCPLRPPKPAVPGCAPVPGNLPPAPV
jgi:hypothetical protein